MTNGWQAFAGVFQSWLSDRVELSFGADPERHGTMTNGQGQGVLDAIESYAQTVPFAAPVAGGWVDHVLRFCADTEPFGFFCKVDWHRNEAERLTVYCRYRNGSVEQGRLEESSRVHGFAWPTAALKSVRAAFGTEPFLVGLRVDRDGRRQLSVYYVVKPSFDGLVSELVPALTGACGLPSGVPERAAADLRQLHEPDTFDRLGVELGVQCSEDGHLRATVYLREIGHETALRFVDAGRRLVELTEALPTKHFLYVGVRYDRTGRSGWKLYTLLRPVRPIDELPLAGPPDAGLLNSGFRGPATGATLP
jgi:hypothetical protein